MDKINAKNLKSNNRIERKFDIEKNVKKAIMIDAISKESSVSQILKLEETIEALGAEIKDVTDKLGEKSRKTSKIITDESTETMTSAVTSTTTERQDSTYYPMDQENPRSQQSKSGEKKIRIKLPQKKVEKPKIQPYEFPLSEPLPKIPTKNEEQPDSTTIVYAIPYNPEDKETFSKYLRL